MADINIVKLIQLSIKPILPITLLSRAPFLDDLNPSTTPMIIINIGINKNKESPDDRGASEYAKPAAI